MLLFLTLNRVKLTTICDIQTPFTLQDENRQGYFYSRQGKGKLLSVNNQRLEKMYV